SSWRVLFMPVSVTNSKLIYDALKACDVKIISALPETWLVHLIRMAEEDPDMTLVRLAKEEEGIGISAGAHLAGVNSALLMQNHGFLAAINPIVSLAFLYKIPLLTIYPELEHSIVVTIMGAVAVELYVLGHRHNFFYLEHAMGLASSMGLGIALSIPEHKVIVIDGDGSLLMNLGTLSTMARYKPGNLLHIVFDNESLLSVGGFPTATSTGTDLAGIARASGAPSVMEANTPDSLARSVHEALASNTLTTIISKVEAIGPKTFHMDLPLLENRFQFKRSLEAMQKHTSALDL